MYSTLPFNHNGSFEWCQSKRTFAVKAFYKIDDCVKVLRRKFPLYFSLRRYDLFRQHIVNVEETDLALSRSAPDNTETVRAAVIRSPRRLIRCQSVCFQFRR